MSLLVGGNPLVNDKYIPVYNAYSGQTFNIYYDGVLGEQGVKPTAITHVFATGGKQDRKSVV